MTEESKPRVPTDKLVKAYLKMTASLAEKRRAYEAEEKVLKGKMAKVKSALLAYCKEENLDSVKTSEGLFFRTVKRNYWTNTGSLRGSLWLNTTYHSFCTSACTRPTLKSSWKPTPTCYHRG